MDCNVCPKKNKCTKLCKEAEIYVNQDYKREKEVPLSKLTPYHNYVIERSKNPWENKSTKEINYQDIQRIKNQYKLKNKQSNILYDYYVAGMSYTELKTKYNMSKQSIHRILSKINIS